MHHFFEAITNTSGESLVGYFARVVNPSNLSAVTLASDNSGTPIAVLSGVANMAKTDEYGNLDFYVEPGTYHLDIYDPNSTTFRFRVPNVAMTSTKGEKGDKGDRGDQGQGLPDLLGTTGATLVGYGDRTVAERLDEVVNARDEGAQGIGPIHDDRAALQAAINKAKARGVAAQSQARLFIPAGRYTVYGSLRIPNDLIIEGEPGTIIDNQSYASPFPLLVNDDPAGFYNVTLRDLIVRGGTYGLKVDVTGAIAEFTMEHVRFDLQTSTNVQFNKLLQTSRFVRCYFMDSPYGFVVQAHTTNLVVWDQCTFGSHTYQSLHLNSNEACRVQSCQFEAGAVTGRVTVQLDNATRGFVLSNCYFENTHEVALKETGSTGTTLIDGNHFTGAKLTGSDAWASYRFQSDGMINFGTNDFGEVRGKVEAPDALIRGFNNKLSLAESNVNIWSHRHERGGKVAAKRRNGGDSIVFDVVFSRASAASRQTLNGLLRTAVSGANTSAGLFDSQTSVHPFSVSADGAGIMHAKFDAAVSSRPAGSFTIALAEVGATTTAVTLRVTVTANGASPAGTTDALFNLEWDAVSRDDANHIQVALPA